MADKKVSDLIAAEQIYEDDVFVLEQDGTAKKLTGQILMNWLTAAADGHGGISDISKIGTSGLQDTYRITLADKTAFDFVVTNGANGAKGDKGEPGDRGAKGDNGKDGVSATHSWNGTVLTVTSASGSSSADLKGAKGDDGDDGTSVTIRDIVESSDDGGTNVVMFSDGNNLMIKNGISARHSWSGTVLTVTSASGSSSADLKGDPGEKGADGAALNLYSGTADFSLFNPIPNGWLYMGETDLYGNKVYNVGSNIEVALPRIPAKAGETFTWSASARTHYNYTMFGFRIYAYEYDPNNNKQLTYQSLLPIESASKEEVTVSRTFTCQNNCMLEIRLSPYSTSGSLCISSFKLESGLVKNPRWCKSADDLKGEKGDKGDKGADGTMIFEDLTDEQKASLKGSDGSGINLYNGSADFSGDWENLGLWTDSGETDSNGNVVLRGQCTNNRDYLYQLVPAKAGETFTLSALLRCDSSGVPVPPYVLEYDPDTREIIDTQSYDHAMSSTEETKVSFTHTCQNDCLLAMGLITMTAPFYISSLKLESGKVENPRWCESVDDLKGDGEGGYTDLGYIEDIADYDASTVEELLDMLVEPGKYTFTDENPYQYFVEVREGEGINDPMVFQSYWSTEHGLSRILFRTGHLGGDEPYWGNWTCLNTGVTDLGTFPEFCESAMSNNSIFFEEGKYRFVDIEDGEISVTVERIENTVYQTYWNAYDPMLIYRRVCLLRSGVFNPNTVELGEFEVYSPAGVNEMIVELDWEEGEASKSEMNINVHLGRKGATVMAKDENGFYGLAYVDDIGVYFNYSDTTYVKVDGWTITKVEKSGGSKDAVLYTPQTLTEAQKAQARENIGVIGSNEVFTSILELLKHAVYDTDMSDTLEELEEAIRPKGDVAYKWVVGVNGSYVSGTNEAMLVQGSTSRAMCLAKDVGIPITYGANHAATEMSPYSPVLIPDGAVSVTVRCPGFGISFHELKLDGGKWFRLYDIDTDPVADEATYVFQSDLAKALYVKIRLMNNGEFFEMPENADITFNY